jgi:hypothetical protein
VIDGAPLFDRRVPGALLDALGSGGAFAWVTELARLPVATGLALDLGLRATPKSPNVGHATLYQGTTQVLGLLIDSRGLFSLTPHQKGGRFEPVEPPFDENWRTKQPLSQFSGSMPTIHAHVSSAIDAAPPGLQSEGFYQAALAKPNKAAFTLVDRELMFPFANGASKTQTIEQLRTPLVKVQRALVLKHRWKTTKPPGDKLDALAIDRDGRLLAIEVKPGNLLGPANLFQVAMYVRLLRAWIDADEALAREVLEGMARQRAALGLGLPEPNRLAAKLEVVPVLAIGKPIIDAQQIRHQFKIVRDALNEDGEPLNGLLNDLRFCAIEKSGEISIIDASELDERFD